jgi:DNA-binding NtrC family response regulator
MVVEDDTDIRNVAERILHREGYRVITASGGDAALELADQHGGSIDLVLTDVVMPGMLGTELVRSLHDRWPSIRVLLMSGYAPPVVRNGSENDSLRDSPLLDKPFSAGSLLNKVHEILSGT